jgi:hypothetical protein
MNFVRLGYCPGIPLGGLTKISKEFSVAFSLAKPQADIKTCSSLYIVIRFVFKTFGNMFT